MGMMRTTNIQSFPFAIYEPRVFLSESGGDDILYVITGCAEDLATAKVFIKKLKDCVVRDVYLDAIVLIKKS